MHFKYCPHCGARAVEREIGDEGMIPYCEACETPLWDLFATSVICAVVNEENEIALLRQAYVSAEHEVCVAGIMKPGESAEDAAVREIEEELGLKTEKLAYVRSYPYESKEMLMLGFRADVRKKAFVLSKEVDAAAWVPIAEAPGRLREGGIARQLVCEVLERVTGYYSRLGMRTGCVSRMKK